MNKKATTPISPSDYDFNLSDFALFLSVMKNKRAYECTLSIILEEPDIKIQEVKVEQVILNRSGKRAIRLDAWAVSEDQRQFNMEMQNNSHVDDLPRRSRFYQGMMDTPVLKSGKHTKYRELPSTVIIFITQEDIFHKDRAKYTFIEQCIEEEGMQLSDGTKKIFLNMTSKNGSQELISLLQYMKETRIDNPDIIVQDSRILELDHIVTEVRESDEWEAVTMNFMEYCMEYGVKQGLEQGLQQGLQQGEQLKLLSMIRKKYQKGLELPEIAEILEESEDTIQPFLNLISMHPDWNDKEIIEHLQ